MELWWKCKGIIYFEIRKPGQTITTQIDCDSLDTLNKDIKKKRPIQCTSNSSILAVLQGVTTHYANYER